MEEGIFSMEPVYFIGICAFLSSFLGCFQILNLQHRHRIWLSLTSCAIAISQLTVYRLAPKVEGFEAYTVYVLGGLIGANLALYLKSK